MKSLSRLICSLALITLSLSVSAQSTSENKSEAKTDQKEQTIKIKVSGLTCNGDLKDIQKMVSEIEGVTSIKPQGKVAVNTVFEVTFNPAKTSEDDIRKAVESTPGCSNPNARPYKVKQG